MAAGIASRYKTGPLNVPLTSTYACKLQPTPSSAYHTMRASLPVVTNGVRFDFVSVRQEPRELQLQEIRLFGNASSSPLPIASVSNPSGHSPAREKASNLVDGGLGPGSKFVDLNMKLTGSCVIELLIEGPPQQVTAYELFTANDNPGRDPTSWRIALLDPVDKRWRMRHVVEHMAPPLMRFTSYGRVALEATTLASSEDRLHMTYPLPDLDVLKKHEQQWHGGAARASVRTGPASPPPPALPPSLVVAPQPPRAQRPIASPKISSALLPPPAPSASSPTPSASPRPSPPSPPSPKRSAHTNTQTPPSLTSRSDAPSPSAAPCAAPPSSANIPRHAAPAAADATLPRHAATPAATDLPSPKSAPALHTKMADNLPAPLPAPPPTLLHTSQHHGQHSLHGPVGVALPSLPAISAAPLPTRPSESPTAVSSAAWCSTALALALLGTALCQAARAARQKRRQPPTHPTARALARPTWWPVLNKPWQVQARFATLRSGPAPEDAFVHRASLWRKTGPEAVALLRSPAD